MLENDDLGTHGEAKFCDICTSVGIIPTPPHRDRNGWDCILEFGTESHEVSDVHKAKYECKVQIKSSWTEDGNRDINLHKLKLLAVNNSPTFIVFPIFTFDNDTEATSLDKLFISHLDRELIDRILGRCVEKEQSGLKLNDFDLTIKTTERTELTKPFGPSLKTYIETCIQDQDEYIINKIREVELAGYENPTYKVTFKVRNQEQAVLDSLFGDGNIELDDVVVTAPDRYGVKGETVDLGDNTEFAIRSTSDQIFDGRVVFSRDKIGSDIEFSSKLHKPAVNTMVSLDQRKLRIEAPLFDVILGRQNDESTFDIEIHNNKQATFPELLRTLELVDMIWNIDNPVTMRAEYGEGRVLKRTIFPDQTESLLEDLIDVTRNLNKHVCPYISLDTTRSTINELDNQIKLIEPFNTVMSMSNKLHDMLIQLPKGGATTKISKGAGLSLRGCPVGNKVVMGFFSNTCDEISYHAEKNVYAFPETKLVVNKMLLLDDFSDSTKAKLRDYAQELAIELSGQDERYVFQDMQQLEAK